MSDRRHQHDVTRDLLVLYELSLAVGVSLDLDESCDIFCRTIMARKNLTYAAVWIEGEMVLGGRPGHLEMVHAHPARPGPRPCVPREHPFLQTMPESGACSCLTEDRLALPQGSPQFNGPGVVSWFRLTGVGYLEVGVAGAREAWPRVELGKLRNVLDKFAISLQGCLAHGSVVAAYEERMRSEEALQTTRNRNAWLTDNVADVIWTMDEDLQITFVSPAIKQFAGYSPADLMRMEMEDFLAPESLDQVRRALHHLNRRARERDAGALDTYTMELAFRTTVDSVVWGEASMRILWREGGTRFEIMGVIRDISHRRQSEQMLIRAKDMAEEASRSKSAFLANMSHEIRTPLNGVVGMTRILRRSGLDDKQREVVNTIQRSADTLLGLINNILDFSKIEAGKMALERRGFALSNVVEDVATLAYALALEKKLRVYCDVPPGLPDYFVGDPLKIRQVLLNLVTNAVKFTHQGHVLLKVRQVEQSAARPRMAITVEDTGIGIPPGRQEVIFESFTQVDDSTSREFGGSGLGLAISQQLAQLMGAQLRVAGNESGGSSFTLEIPLEMGRDRRSAPRDQAPELEGKVVLLLSEDVLFVRQLQAHLRSWSMVTVVLEPEQVRANFYPAMPAPDLVIRDCRDCPLPVCQGRKRLPVNLRSVPLVKLNLEQVSRGVETADRSDGRDVVLGGFVGRHLLLSAVRGVLSDNGLTTGWQGPGPEETADLAGRRVLVAEDNQINQQVVAALLGEWGCDVMLVENGREAVQAVEERRFDLILMDVQMPGMDGLEATRAIRRLEAAREGRTPIVALTAHAFSRDRKACLAAGMDAFLSKPLNEIQCLRVMKEVLEGTWRAERGPAEETGSEPAKTAAPEEANLPLVDWERLERSTRGHRDFARKLVLNYASDAEQSLEKLEALLRQEDMAQAAALGHSLKGASLTVGADRFSLQAAQLETACREGRVGRARSISSRLPALLEQTLQQFTRYMDAQESPEDRGMMT